MGVTLTSSWLASSWVAYTLALVAALTYTLSSLWLKKALEHGAGLFRVVFWTNWVMLPFFIPLLGFGYKPLASWDVLWSVALCALLNFAGMALTFVVIRFGSISVQTPVMGSKVLMVAGLSVALGLGPITLGQSLGAGLSMVAVVLLGLSEQKGPVLDRRRLVLTLAASLLCALCFAACDVCMARYAAQVGQGYFLFLVVVLTALLCLGLLPFTRAEGSLWRLPAASLRWLWPGMLLMGVEALSFYCAIAYFSDPTTTNILYASRGVWSVVLVASVGHYFGIHESLKDKATLALRLTGAVCLFVALILVLLT
jgi:drug/metabolite transporter (DMT)-like permease